MDYRFNDNIPIYIQLVEMIKTDIVSGKYQPGDKLPAVRDLAMELGVNPNTVQRAFSELEREDLVKSDRTNGRYVTEDKKKIKELLKVLSEKYIDELFEKLNSLGMSDGQIVKMINNERKKSKWKH